MSEELNKEIDEILEDVLGGNSVMEDHSPALEEDGNESLEETGNAAPEAAAETFDPSGDEEETAVDDSARDEGTEEKSESTPAEKADSVPVEKGTVPDAEQVSLQEEISNYKKRLHDTQEAMHKANEERAKLQKELEELRNKKAEPAEESEDSDGGDNWFAEEKETDKVTTADLESKMKELEEKQEKFQQEQAMHAWQKEADAFAKGHEDFNTLVYEKLEPLLDEESGDPAVLAAYMRWQDKSPAGAYAFAKKMFRPEESTAESPHEEKEAKASIDPTTGKAGLDRINSADFSEPKRQAGNMIDDVFG